MTHFGVNAWGLTEAVVQRCSVKKVFLEILQNSQENTCARVSFFKKESLAQVFSCEFCEISKNTFFYRTPLVAASGLSLNRIEIQILFVRKLFIESQLLKHTKIQELTSCLIKLQINLSP